MPSLAEEISAHATELLAVQHGRMYGNCEGVPIGAGTILAGVAIPLFNTIENRFQVRASSVLVLTHECDLDEDNAKLFNDTLAFVTLTGVREVVDAFQNEGRTSELKGFMGEVAKNRVNRMTFLPPMGQFPDCGLLDLGALLNWNTIGHTHISQIKEDRVKQVCTLSDYGLGKVDISFTGHFLREKAATLPRMAS